LLDSAFSRSAVSGIAGVAEQLVAVVLQGPRFGNLAENTPEDRLEIARAGTSRNSSAFFLTLSKHLPFLVGQGWRRVGEQGGAAGGVVLDREMPDTCGISGGES